MSDSSNVVSSSAIMRSKTGVGDILLRDFLFNRCSMSMFNPFEGLGISLPVVIFEDLLATLELDIIL